MKAMPLETTQQDGICKINAPIYNHFKFLTYAVVKLTIILSVCGVNGTFVFLLISLQKSASSWLCAEHNINAYYYNQSQLSLGDICQAWAAAVLL